MHWNVALAVVLIVGAFFMVHSTITGNVVQTDVPATAYAYVGHSVVSSSDGLSDTFYHVDYMGSSRVLTAEDGTIAGRYEYAPFGGTFGKPSRGYLGLQHETTGILAGVRTLDPGTGRFMQVDPIWSGGSSYSYADNNPLIKQDKDGRAAHYVEPYMPPSTEKYFGQASGAVAAALMGSNHPLKGYLGPSKKDGSNDFGILIYHDSGPFDIRREASEVGDKLVEVPIVGISETYFTNGYDETKLTADLAYFFSTSASPNRESLQDFASTLNSVSFGDEMSAESVLPELHTAFETTRTAIQAQIDAVKLIGGDTKPYEKALADLTRQEQLVYSQYKHDVPIPQEMVERIVAKALPPTPQ
ncbi:MAG: RHS repeat-associated core domain-containing protein [Candidatus Woesearchaeota archaeon]